MPLYRCSWTFETELTAEDQEDAMERFLDYMRDNFPTVNDVLLSAEIEEVGGEIDSICGGCGFEYREEDYPDAVNCPKCGMEWSDR